jgi:hypothetical protein
VSSRDEAEQAWIRLFARGENDPAESVREQLRHALDAATDHSDLVARLMPIAYPLDPEREP